MSDRFITGAVMGLATVLTQFGPYRLGRCGLACCTGVFVDTSPNGSRRYCSEQCGNRANVTAFRFRLLGTRAGGSAGTAAGESAGPGVEWSLTGGKACPNAPAKPPWAVSAKLLRGPRGNNGLITGPGSDRFVMTAARTVPVLPK